MAKRVAKANDRKKAAPAKGKAKPAVSATARAATKPDGPKAAKSNNRPTAKQPKKVVKKAAIARTSPQPRPRRNSESDASAKAKAPARSRLTPETIAEFRELLLAKRREIIGDVGTLTDEALRSNRQDAAGDLSLMPNHMADLGSDNWEQEFTLGLIENQRHLLREIDEALDRIESGEYGICQATGKPISKARLRAQPWARYCIEYARSLETRQVI